MAFWGVEVKPGKPFSHKADTARERLHISQATLGNGNGTKKSVVQCNVGEKSPVFLCSLFPEKAESCQLNLEFDEPDEVVFSVIGPRSVHLTGYYLSDSTRFKHDVDSESYGEDIADTETERSADDGNEDEDKYEDSFIDDDDDDDDEQLVQPSSVSDDEESPGLVRERKPKNKKASSRRLKKAYQILSDEDDTNADTCKKGLGSENEDKLTLLSPYNSVGRSRKSETEENFGNETSQTVNMDVEDGGNGSAVLEQKPDAILDSEVKRQADQHDSILHSSELGLENGAKENKKKKKKSKKNKELKSGGEDEPFSEMIIEGDLSKQNIAKVDQSSQNIDAENEKDRDIDFKNEEDQGIQSDKLPDQHEFLLPCAEVGSDNSPKSKKKKKSRSKEKKKLKAGREDDSILKSNQVQNDMNVDQSIEDDSFEIVVDQKTNENIELKSGTEDDSVIKLDQAQPSETNADQSRQDITAESEDHKRFYKSPSPSLSFVLVCGIAAQSCKGRPAKKEKDVAVQSSFHRSVSIEKKDQVNEDNSECTDTTRNEENQKQDDDKNAALEHQSELPSDQMGAENCSRPKRKRRRTTEDKKTTLTNAANYNEF